MSSVSKRTLKPLALLLVMARLKMQLWRHGIWNIFTTSKNDLKRQHIEHMCFSFIDLL